MADKKLAQLRTLFAKMPEGAGKDAVAKKIAKLEASQPKEVVEVKEEVKVETKKAKAPRKPKATKSASGKEKRHVFEKEVEGGKEVKVVMATSPELAKEAMQESGFEFVKTITRGRSPKEGFIATGKAKKTKAKTPERASKATRESMAKDAGMTAEKAEKVASKVASSKKRGRKPMDKKAFLFEMPLKTQAGKVKRKVVTATSEASAIKAAGKNYTLVKELEKGENPKVGVQPIEGFVAPAPKKRGRKPKAKTLEEVTEKSEAIGEGIGIANKEIGDQLRDLANGMILEMEEKVDSLMEELKKVSRQLNELGREVFYLGTEADGKKMAHGGTTHEKIKISDSDMKKLHEGKEVTISGVTLDFGHGGQTPADVMKGLNDFAMFALNFPPNFVSDAFDGNQHLIQKFNDLYDRVGSDAVVVKFYAQLDGGNKRRLQEYIADVYADKMADGGRVGDKDFVLDNYYVIVDKDDYEEGMTDQVASWNSFDYGESNKSFSSKSALMDFIKEVIDRDTSEDDTKESNFDIESDEDGTTINYGVLCKYDNLGRGRYGNYEKATREEIEQWKKGDLELFNVGFTFKVKVFEPRKRAEFAHGGKTHRQGYDDKLDESLAIRRGAGRSKQQSRKDRRDESAAMERSMGRRKYSSVGTMDIDDRMI
ncbi:MAG: hypothetical protein CMD87_05745 [Gammaproteobacteria bacterium]|nr:hypothetical protein [Gammaproteobacteria bacterium]